MLGPIGRYNVWVAIIIRHHRVENMLIINQELFMRRARVVPVKHDMVDLVFFLR